MFKINDYVMYGMTGVCKVLDITTEDFKNNINKKYYVLTPMYSKNTIIKVPVDNEKISIRKLLTRDEISLVLNAIPQNEILWEENEKSRNENFKLMLRTGQCENLIAIINSININKKDKKSVGKKICKRDEEIMDTAERLINEEFATVLQIETEEVSDYILNGV